MVEIDRVLLADGTPMATSMTYLLPSLFEASGMPTIDELDRGSLYTWLRNAGVFFAGGDERIEGALADAQTARDLGVRPAGYRAGLSQDILGGRQAARRACCPALPCRSL